MIYLVICRYRNLLGKWVNEVHPCVFDNAESASVCKENFANKKRAMAWVVETELPAPPPFKLVDEAPADDGDVEYIDGGKLLL